MARKAGRASPRLAYGKIGEQAPTGHKGAGRELGIPAVVGCGNATARISSGDWLRVDGAHGTVEVLQSRSQARGAGDTLPRTVGP